jgi:hypothetical protein
MTHIICENQRIITWEDGLVWKLTLVATPGVGTWNVKATLTRRGSTQEKHGRWSARTGWSKNMWYPLADSEIAQIAEEWMRANPVPISDGVEVRRWRP